MKFLPILTSLALLAAAALHAAEPQTVRVLVWDEQQPEQKKAYGDKFLGISGFQTGRATQGDRKRGPVAGGAGEIAGLQPRPPRRNPPLHPAGPLRPGSASGPTGS